MGIFDIFTNQNAQDAANAQIRGIQQGQQAATGDILGGSQALTSNFMQAIAPYTTNYGQAQGGVNAYLSALGIPTPGSGSNAANNYQAITDQLRNSPGYQFQLNQGNQNILRNAAQVGGPGNLASGGTLNALQTYGQGLADTTYQQYINNLSPFLGASNAAAGGIASGFQGLGTGLNANANTLAQLGWTSNTAQGNAQANADLANNQASANFWNLAQNAAKLIASDVRVKTDIAPVGKLDDGTNIYSFKYRREIDPSGRTHLGVMAQEVERANPAAVKEFAGIKFVDYEKATEPARHAREMFDSFLKAA